MEASHPFRDGDVRISGLGRLCHSHEEDNLPLNADLAAVNHNLRTKETCHEQDSYRHHAY
jgi:hypothetical protein